MFDTERIPMQLASATVQLERVKKGEDQYPVALLGLALELTPELAGELGADIKDHCYTKAKAIRRELKTVNLSLPGELQQIVIHLVPEGTKEPHTTLRQVAVRAIRVSRIVRKKKGKEDGAKLLATLQLRADYRDKDLRDFLAKRFGQRLFWTFADEQRTLPELGEGDKPAKEPSGAKKRAAFGRTR